MSAQPALALMPAAGLVPCTVAEANRLLTDWGHYLGPCNRPFGIQAWTFDVDDLGPISVAVTASTVSATAGGLDRHELVELARLCTRPGFPWATRIMLRLWREVAAPRWPHWPVTGAVAYSQNDRHDGRLYRFDGWRKITDKAGSSGGGSWSTPRAAGDAVAGPKTLWLWRYSS